MTTTTLGAAREFIEQVLREHAPDRWAIVTDERNLDTLDRTTVLVSVTGVERQPEAPIGAWATACQITIASPKADNLPAAETDLERDLGDLLALIEDHLATPWQDAAKRLYAQRYLCWDVTVNVTTTRTA